MAQQIIQDPQMQNVMSNLVGSMFGSSGRPGAGAATARSTDTTNPSSVTEGEASESEPLNPMGPGFENIFQS